MAGKLVPTIVLCCLVWQAAAVRSVQNSVAGVERIFIQIPESYQRNLHIESLTKELKQYGFEVVDTQAQADAILTAEVQIEVVIDGDGGTPDKSIFSYRLTLPDKTVIWKYKVKFINTPNLTNDYKNAAKKTAEKLFRDRESVIKKQSPTEH